MAITVSSPLFDIQPALKRTSISRYADTILAPEEIANKQQSISSASKIVSVTQSNFYKPPVLPKKVCCCCSKPLSTSYIEDDLSYCKECHLKLYNKGEWYEPH